MKQLNLQLIKEKRIEKGISQQKMAEILGFKNASTYLKYENGKYHFKADMLPAMAKALKIKMENFFKN